jgi:hypothetical protein
MTKRRYGVWAGRPEGNADEDETHCIEEVHDKFVGYQCSRRRGYGPNGLYCKQHARWYEHNLTTAAPDREKHPAGKPSPLGGLSPARRIYELSYP